MKKVSRRPYYHRRSDFCKIALMSLILVSLVVFGLYSFDDVFYSPGEDVTFAVGSNMFFTYLITPFVLLVVVGLVVYYYLIAR